MWSIGFVPLLWIAGLVVLKMVTPQQNPAEDAPQPPRSIQLDALKAIRESAYQRWEKRRSYEWQLSLSIWTALAAFCAIVISKDFQLTARYATAVSVAAIGLIISRLHHSYVLKMFEHTIADVILQRWAEQEMYRLAFETDMPSTEKGCPGYPFYPPMSKYGRVQAAITLMLACAAVGSVLAPRAAPPATQTQPHVTIPADAKSSVGK